MTNKTNLTGGVLYNYSHRIKEHFLTKIDANEHAGNYVGVHEVN